MNIQIDTNNRDKIIEKDLSYKQEKVYQKAVEKLLIREKLSYKKELPVDLLFEGDKIGKYYLDFLIENRVVLELFED